MSQADRDKLATVKRLAELAAPHAEEIITVALEVMRDKESRQRLNAATFLAELMAAGASEGNGNNGSTKILIVSAGDIQRLGEMHRAEVKGT